MRYSGNIKKLAAILLLLVPFLGMAKKHKVTYFSPRSFYIYSMASWITEVPSDYYGFEDDAASPVLGMGYTIVNFGNRTLLNLEFDAATSEFDFDLFSPTRIWFYTLTFTVEYRSFLQLPLNVYVGFGGAMLHYSYKKAEQNGFTADWSVFDENEYVFAANAGIKVRLVKNLMLRAELRHYWKSFGESFFWDDEWEYYYDDDTYPFGTAISIGLELHF
jgi:opacity protein-like surface antigen